MNIPQNFNVIPVKDKIPQVAWKEFTERKQTPEERKKFLESKEQLGIVTGKVSNILVLDDDGGLDLEKYKVPKTWTVETPRGGRHYYFKYLEGLSEKVTTRTEILPKVDVRGDGGYVVFYGFKSSPITTPLAPAPKWLIDLLPNKSSNNNACIVKPDNWIIEALENIKPGRGSNGRTPTFVRVIGGLKAKGLSEGDVLARLTPYAEKYEYQNRLEKLIADQYKRYPQVIHTENEQPEDSSIEAFLKDTETVEWLVPNLIAKKSIGFVAGLPETGKTWMLIDLAIECARGGGLWLNRFPVKQAKVLFIDQERFKGETQRRFRTVISAKNGIENMLKGQLFVKSGSTTRLDIQNSYEVFRKVVDEIRPELIIVDSFATFHNSEENNRQSIQAVLERVKQLRNDFGCTFLFIHHESKLAFSKEEGEPSIAQMAGSIAIPAACETVMTVRKHEDGSMVYHTKSTMAPTVAPFLVKVTDGNEEKTSIRVEAY